MPPLTGNKEKICEEVQRPDRFMHVIPAKARIQGFRLIVTPAFAGVTITFTYLRFRLDSKAGWLRRTPTSSSDSARLNKASSSIRPM